MRNGGRSSRTATPGLSNHWTSSIAPSPGAALAALTLAPSVVVMTALGAQTSGVNTAAVACCSVCPAPRSQPQQGSWHERSAKALQMEAAESQRF